MLKEPVNIKDYHNLTLKLLAWPQGADEKQGYLKEKVFYAPEGKLVLTLE
jgi:hypothetical protein